MRIVHIDRQRSFTGQVARHFREATALRAKGHELAFVASPRSELLRRGREADVPCIALPMRGLSWYRSILHLSRFLAEFRPDIVHAHGARDHLLALAAIRALPREIVRPRLVRTKHNHTGLRSGPFSRMLYRATDLTITVSEFVRSRLIADGLTAERLVTIPTGIDLDRFQVRPPDRALARQLGLARDSLILGHVSSLHQRKGVGDLLHAFAILAEQMDGLQLLVVGRNYAPWLELARELGLAERVVFTGAREDVPELLALMDIVVAPSHDEALGTAIVEAMALERAIVATDVGGIPECLGDRQFLAPPRDPEALASRIAMLIRDPELRVRRGALARVRALAQFDAMQMVAHTEEAYARVLTQARGRSLDDRDERPRALTRAGARA